MPSPSDRERLARAVEACLAADPRVERVQRFGSLAGDPDLPDRRSDIDVDVLVASPATDAELVVDVPELLGAVGPVRAWRLLELPGFGHVAAVWFEGHPPWWHVDVRCRSAVHVPAPAAVAADAWADGYTHWMLAVKRLARAFGFLEEHRRAVTAAAGGGPLLPAPVVADLRALLAAHHAAAPAGDERRERFHQLCLEVDAELMRPHEEFA